MSEDLVNIIYENRHGGSDDKSDVAGGITSGLTLPSTLGLDHSMMGSWLSPLSQLTSSVTLSAMRLADDISHTLTVQAEAATEQIQREFNRTLTDNRLNSV